mmetsp:Transcript_29323/g.79384  ORF Transcript_29323/g.79384 Transcript_29323/m.79384 type:complete len:225 (+) Transcript_29323:1768-2442(+)
MSAPILAFADNRTHPSTRITLFRVSTVSAPPKRSKAYALHSVASRRNGLDVRTMEWKTSQGQLYDPTENMADEGCMKTLSSVCFSVIPLLSVRMKNLCPLASPSFNLAPSAVSSYLVDGRYTLTNCSGAIDAIAHVRSTLQDCSFLSDSSEAGNPEPDKDDPYCWTSWFISFIPLKLKPKDSQYCFFLPPPFGIFFQFINAAAIILWSLFPHVSKSFALSCKIN